MSNYTNLSSIPLMYNNRTDSAQLGLRIFKGIGLGTLILGNWFANTICIIVLHRLRDLNPVTKILMFSMTAADIATGCLGMFVLVSVAMDGWVFGHALCQFTGILNSTLIAVAMFSLLTINTERYIAVTRPFEYQVLVTTGRAYGALVALWSTALASGMLNHLLPWRRSAYHPVLHSCVADPIDPDRSDLFGTAWNCVFFLLPILVTLVMFLRLYRIAKHHATRIAAQSTNAPALVAGSKRKPNLKGSATFFLMTISILSLSTPTLLGYLYENISRRHLPVLFSHICTLLVFSYSIVNVGIYYARNTAFRRTAKGIVLKLCRRGDSTDNNSTAVVVSAAWK